MTLVRRTLAPLTAIWLFCQIGTVAFVPIVLWAAAAARTRPSPRADTAQALCARCTTSRPAARRRVRCRRRTPPERPSSLLTGAIGLSLSRPHDSNGEPVKTPSSDRRLRCRSAFRSPDPPPPRPRSPHSSYEVATCGRMAARRTPVRLRRRDHLWFRSDSASREGDVPRSLTPAILSVNAGPSLLDATTVQSFDRRAGASLGGFTWRTS